LQSILNFQPYKKNHHLPTELPKDIDIKTVMKYMESDKKKKNNEIYIAVLEKIGSAVKNTVAVERSQIKKSLASTYKIKSAVKSIADSIDFIEVLLPGSKSITNRALLLCALGEGTTVLKGILDADDTVVMKRALTALDACEIIEHKNSNLIIKGHAGKIKSPEDPIYVGKIIEIRLSKKTLEHLLGF
jgi:pentafunctional AROM polypeptide